MNRGIHLTLAIGTASIALLAMLALLALSVGPARSALAAGPYCIVDPDGGGDYTIIQDAVDDTGCITINVMAGTYTENIIITRSLTLQGAGAASTTVDGARTGVVISVTNGAAVTADGFTITGGDGSTNSGKGGGIFIKEATAAIRNNVIVDNVASQIITTAGQGGGICVTSSTSPVLIYSNTIQANAAYSVSLASGTAVLWWGAGGGIVIGDASSAIITGNQILSNVAARTNIPGVAWGGGGGIAFFGEDTTIDGNTIRGNLGNEVGGNGSGGGIALWGGVATVTNNDVVQNTAAVSGTNATGGGVYASGLQTLTLANNWVMSNTAGITLTGSGLFAGGGGVRVQGSGAGDTVIVEDNHFIGNVAARMMRDSSGDSASFADGGGLNIVTISTTLIINNEVRENIAVKNLSLSGDGGWGGRPSGGGMHLNANDRVTLSDNEIRDNVTAVQQRINDRSSTSLGGGVTLEGVNAITITGNTVAGNVAVVSGSLTSTMDEWYSASGGGVHIDGFGLSNDRATVEGNLVIGNVVAKSLLVSGGSGGGAGAGGIGLTNIDDVILSENEIRDNIAVVRQAADGVTLGSEAGGIALNNLDNATVRNNTVADNTTVVTGSLTSDTGELYFPWGGGISASCWSKPDCSLSFLENDILNNTTAVSFTVGGANAGGQPGGGGFHLGSGIVLLDSNVISGNVAYLGGDRGHGGAIDVNASTVMMQQNHILGNRSHQATWNPVVWLWGGDLTSTNNVYARNTGGTAVNSFATATLINDTFYDNGPVGVRADFSSTIRISNTIVYSHAEGLKLNDAGSVLGGDYNLLSNTVDYAGGVMSGTHDIIGQDPLFVDAAADDFHLDSTSPAIDKANDAVAPADDFDGDQRPSDGDFDGTARADIGADEYWPQNLYLPIILRNVSPEVPVKQGVRYF